MQELLAGFAQAQSEADALRHGARAAYSTGNYFEITSVRVEEFGHMLSNMGFFGAQVLAMFLFGAWLGRQGVFAAPERYRELFRNLLILAVVAGVPLSVWFANVNLRTDYTDIYDPGIATAFMINLFAGPLLTLGYVAAIVFAMRTRAARAARSRARRPRRASSAATSCSSSAVSGSPRSAPTTPSPCAASRSN
jgi:uncharacterized protein